MASRTLNKMLHLNISDKDNFPQNKGSKHTTTRNEIKQFIIPQPGRQRQPASEFISLLTFPAKKLTAKIYHKRLTGQFMR